MKLHLSPFRPDDLADICLLEKISFRKGGIPKEQLCRMIIHSDVVCYCLKDEQKKLIAFILLKINKIIHSMTILSLAVQKEYQGKGWGQKLVIFAKAIGKNLRLDYLDIQIEDQNKPVKKFLKNSGFQITKTFSDYLEKKQVGIEMRLQI